MSKPRLATPTKHRGHSSIVPRGTDGKSSQPPEHIISPRYEGPILSALKAQGVAAVFALLLLDGGQAARVLGVALLAFWGTTGAVIARYRIDPTPGIVAWTRLGWIPVFAGMSTLTWVLRT